MKKRDLILIYDDYCPLCSWYSGLFVKAGLLDKNGRTPFSEADQSLLSMVDIDRSRNHIPLVDKNSKRVLYGIDAMLEILGGRFPLIKSIGNYRPIKCFLLMLYKLISYNRKVIVAKKCREGKFDCAPDFDVKYRLLFMIIFLAFNTLMLWPIHKYLLTRLEFYQLNFFTLQLVHAGFAGINILVSIAAGRTKAIEFLGQVNMLALITVLLTLILVAAYSIFRLPEWMIMFSLGMIAMYVVIEYFRRMRYASIIKGNKMIIAVNIICMVAFVTYLFS